MSLRQAYKDYLTLFASFGLIIMLILVFYQYLQTNDEKMLYFGLAIVLLAVFGVIARYRFVLDYVKTLFESWK
jgi:hypothetical protein